jgi:hypothetical protein
MDVSGPHPFWVPTINDAMPKRRSRRKIVEDESSRKIWPLIGSTLNAVGHSFLGGNWTMNSQKFALHNFAKTDQNQIIDWRMPGTIPQWAPWPIIDQNPFDCSFPIQLNQFASIQCQQISIQIKANSLNNCTEWI